MNKNLKRCIEAYLGDMKCSGYFNHNKWSEEELIRKPHSLFEDNYNRTYYDGKILSCVTKIQEGVIKFYSCKCQMIFMEIEADFLPFNIRVNTFFTSPEQDKWNEDPGNGNPDYLFIDIDEETPSYDFKFDTKWTKFLDTLNSMLPQDRIGEKQVIRVYGDLDYMIQHNKKILNDTMDENILNAKSRRI